MTMQALSQMPETSVEDLREVATTVRNYMALATAESRQAALDAASKRGLWQRVFPTQFERERQRVAVQGIRKLGESKRELLEVYSSAMVEVARKQADALVAAQGMHLQAALTRFADEKIHDLTSTINASRERFMRETDPQFTMVEQYQHRPELYEPARQAVLHQIEVYFASTKMLLDGFVQSLGSRVSQSK